MKNLRTINSSKEKADQNKLDMERTLSSLRIALEFGLSNPNALIKVSGNKKDDKGRPIHLGAAKDFKSMLDRGESFTDNQITYGLSLYELTMKGLGLPSVGRKHDKNKKHY